MSAGYSTRLKPLVRGDDWTINCDVKLDGSPVALDVTYSAWMTFKEHFSIADASAILQLKSTGAGGSDAEAAFINNPRTGVTNRIQFNATNAQTAAMPNRLRTLYYDIQLKTPSGAIKTLDRGTITMVVEMTLSSS